MERKRKREGERASEIELVREREREKRSETEGVREIDLLLAKRI